MQETILRDAKILWTLVNKIEQLGEVSGDQRPARFAIVASENIRNLEASMTEKCRLTTMVTCQSYCTWKHGNVGQL